MNSISKIYMALYMMIYIFNSSKFFQDTYLIISLLADNLLKYKNWNWQNVLLHAF